MFVTDFVALIFNLYLLRCTYLVSKVLLAFASLAIAPRIQLYRKFEEGITRTIRKMNAHISIKRKIKQNTRKRTKEFKAKEMNKEMFLL